MILKLKSPINLTINRALNAGGRTRTDMELSPRGILSPVRLPISPLRPVRINISQTGGGWQDFNRANAKFIFVKDRVRLIRSEIFTTESTDFHGSF